MVEVKIITEDETHSVVEYNGVHYFVRKDLIRRERCINAPYHIDKRYLIEVINND